MSRPGAADTAAGSRLRFVWMLAARAGTLVMGVVASVVVARALPPEGRGTYYMAVAVGTAAMALGHLSVEQAQTALWSDERRRPSLEANCVPLGLFVGAGAALAALVVAGAFQGRGNIPDLWLLAIACAGVPLGVGVLYASNIAALRDRPQVAGLSALASAAVQCACLVALGLAGRLTVTGVVIVWAVSSAVSLVVLIGAGGVTIGRPRLRFARATCGKGLRLHAGSAASYLLLRSDVFLLNALAGPREVGIYTLAVTLAELSRIAVDVFAQVTLVRQFGRDMGESAAVAARTVRLMVLLGSVSALATVVAVSVLITPVYGPAYAEAATLVAWLVPGILLLSAGRPVATFLLRFRSPWFVVLPSLTALGVNIGLNTVLIPAWGGVGCAVASTAAYTALVAVQMTSFVRMTGTPWRQLLPTGSDTSQITGRLRRRPKELGMGRAQ
ncbi:lipopolysaccharide biosynthesis protein [Streptomyces formicae]|uniref:Oligosaccharide flippase family protein n=1 Tax=Streptomyces formicae TaxID=1616117 RepID=A0ABY3WNL9_9ACTN|nr:oligosaccharide flippase family protein [Streptomyces formicae]UNM14219.1 oligosaccharide flippase family protein [Streptomyces formicae]